MPPRSSSRRKSYNKQTKKMKPLTSSNHHSSPAVQVQGKSDLNILRERNGFSGIESPKPTSEKCTNLVVEQEKDKKKGYYFSAGAAVSARHNEMAGDFEGKLDLEETQKLESQTEDKEVIVEEEIKSVVDFGGEVAADDKSRSVSETQDGDDSKNDENSELVDSGKVKETREGFEAVVDFGESISSSAIDFIDAVKEQADNLLASDDIESKLEENQERDLLIPEETDGIPQDVAIEEVKGLEETELPASEENKELSSVVANEGLRETEAVETIKDLTDAEENKLASAEDKNELSSVVTNEVLRESGETEAPHAEETSILKPDERDEVPPTLTEPLPKAIEEPKLPIADEKVGESSVVQESSKEDANESLKPLTNVPADETTSASVQDKTEIPRSTENPTIVPVTQRQYTSWSSCCGLFEFLIGNR